MIRIVTGIWFGMWATLAVKHVGVPTSPSEMFYWYDALATVAVIAVSLLLGASCAYEYYEEKF